jgi:hypothetical protein
MGIISLYDALNSAMQWYIAKPESLNPFLSGRGRI